MTSTAGQRPFTGWHMLALVVCFFGVIISVNIGMAVVASTSWTGLVVANSYIASQEFEEKRIAHLAQRAAGWTPNLVYGEGTIQLRVEDALREPVDLGEAMLLLNRPVGGHEDKKIALARAGDGSYEGAADLDPGIWEATIAAPATALGPFVLHTRLRIPGDVP